MFVTVMLSLAGRFPRAAAVCAGLDS